MSITIGLIGEQTTTATETLTAQTFGRGSLPVYAAPALVALTGYGQPTDRARSLAVGFDVHLVKPPDHLALLGLVQRLADARRATKAPHLEEPSEPVRRDGEARDDA